MMFEGAFFRIVLRAFTPSPRTTISRLPPRATRDAITPAEAARRPFGSSKAEARRQVGAFASGNGLMPTFTSRGYPGVRALHSHPLPCDACAVPTCHPTA